MITMKWRKLPGIILTTWSKWSPTMPSSASWWNAQAGTHYFCDVHAKMYNLNLMRNPWTNPNWGTYKELQERHSMRGLKRYQKAWNELSGLTSASEKVLSRVISRFFQTWCCCVPTGTAFIQTHSSYLCPSRALFLWAYPTALPSPR